MAVLCVDHVLTSLVLSHSQLFSQPPPPLPPSLPPPVIVFSRSSNRLLAALSLTQLVVFTVLDQQPGK